MKLIYLFLTLLFTNLVFAQENKQMQIDSLRNIIATTEGQEKIDAYLRLTNIYYFEATQDELKRDTLLALYDKMDAEAEKLGNNRARGVMRINRLNILVTAKQYDEVVKLAPNYLKFMEERKEDKLMLNSYYYIYYSLINAYRNQGKTDDATIAVNTMYEHAKENNNNIGMGIALFVMGRIYYDQNRLIEQEKCLREAIVVLKDSALNKLVDVYLHLGNCLIEQERYEEALQITAEMESVIKRYEDENGAPMPNARLNQYMIYTTAYVELKQYDKAEIYCEKVESMSNGTIIPYTARAAIFASRKQYDKALEMADKAIETAYPKYKLLTMKTKMSIWLKKEGNEKMEKLFTEIINLQISEHNEKMNAQLDEIRTQYEVDKITAENELNQVEKVRNRNYFLFALGGCLLLAITLGIWIYNNRIIVRKNRGLYLQIKEQDRLADELKAIKIQYEQISQLAPSDGDAETLRATSLLPGNMQQRQLVARLHEYLLKDKYYSNYNIEIHQLVSEMATNRAFLFESIKVVTGKTLMEFLNDLRLDEAKRLLESSTLTIEAISLECGFNATRTFYRQFRERYRMSPTEYRRFTG